ncbi:S-adenosyl-L-methionine-dependent methyltransferase [Xylariales sp. PMI_506]|nr:S-adenosyl-L-methionine-dependent methyltransferase [Xylariales sp. PMI_506]
MASNETKESPVKRGGIENTISYNNIPVMPVLPSDIVESYDKIPPPINLSLENIPAILSNIRKPGGALNTGVLSQTASLTAQQQDPSFTATANDLINVLLNRTPTGDSVVDPESVIGESLRLYHGYKDGRYLLPNDAVNTGSDYVAEQDRLDLQHEVFRLLYSGWLALAPLPKSPAYVLDIGTGTGLWAFEFAEQNPSSYVIGTDLSSIQPNRGLPNVEFIKADMEEEWVFPRPNAHQSSLGRGNVNSQPNIPFDYVHLRLMFTCFDDARTVMKHAFSTLACNGWIEFQEIMLDGYQANPEFPGDAYQRWADGCTRGAATIGRDLHCVLKYKQWLEEIGFVDVTERKFLLPVGPWPEDPTMKMIGKYNLQNCLEGIRGAGWKMLRLTGMEPDKIEALVNDCLAELKSPQSYTYGFRALQSEWICIRDTLF